MLFWAITGGNLEPGPIAAFTVPEGFIYVVRDVEIALASGITNQINLAWGVALNEAETDVYAMVHLYPGAVYDAPSWAQWKGRHVINPGQTCYVNDQSVGGLSSYTMMGYKLSLP